VIYPFFGFWGGGAGADIVITPYFDRMQVCHLALPLPETLYMDDE